MNTTLSILIKKIYARSYKLVAQTALLMAGFCLILNSCWFNSSGYILKNTGYQAQVDTADLSTSPKKGKSATITLGTDGNYYAEIPRYRIGKETKLMYSTLNDDNSRRTVVEEQGKQAVIIPANYARFLIGSGPKPTGYITLTPVPKMPQGGTQYRVAYRADSQIVRFKYKNKNAAWLYTAGTFNALLVDLPVSITLSCGLAVFFFVVALLEADKKNKSSSSSSSSNREKCRRCNGKGHNSQTYGNGSYIPCSWCGGDGSVIEAY